MKNEHATSANATSEGANADMGHEDLNRAAAEAFGGLLEENTDLLPQWKSAALTLLADGVPRDVAPLQELLDGDHASAHESVPHGDREGGRQ